MMLSEMICKARGITPEAGTIAGVCACCGRPTETGLVFEDTGTFTTYKYFPGGDCLCPECTHIRHDRTYARTMWICTESEYREFKFEEAEAVLKTPPAEPFVVYFTRTWKKPGYLNLVNRINHSQKTYIVGLDYDLITVDAAKRDRYLSFIHQMLDLGVTKGELESGRLSRNRMRRSASTQV
jgi:hypothetical protein